MVLIAFRIKIFECTFGKALFRLFTREWCLMKIIAKLNHVSDGKFHQLPSGELLIHNLEFSDQFPSYRCKTMHRLSRQIVVSSSANIRIAGKTPFNPCIMTKLQRSFSSEYLTRI